MDLFGRKAKKRLVEAQIALKECSEKLVEKQEHINQTNAYWKKQMYAKNKKKEL